ncbi:MAG: hypothetical protein HGA70_01840 [Chlorobiaceae bacterium]|nr:hypothetical protein [Chlorobiaceae bacterium]
MTTTTIQLWPETINEAIEQMIDRMSSADKIEVLNTKEKELYKLLCSQGLLIGGCLGLYNGNKALLKACALTRKSEIEQLLFLDDPEEASYIILEALWKRLRAEMRAPV